MMIDARSVPDATSLDGEVCIVGAGAAGISIARSLASAGFRTILLESGGLTLDSDTQRLNDGENIGLPYFPLIGSRLRYFGGTTGHWGGTCRPFDESDFIGTRGVPSTEWPIRLADVDPYYDEAASIVQLDSSGWAVAEWEDRSQYNVLGLDSNTIETRVAKIVDVADRRFEPLYADEIGRAASAATYLHANVTEIRLADDHASVAEVVVATGAGSFSVRARLFVLAAGGIENVRILLASNRQQPAGVGNGHDLVGRYFIEHPRFVGGVIQPLDARLSASFYQPHVVEGTRVLGYLALAQPLRQAEGLVDVQFRLNPVLAPSQRRARRSADVAALQRIVDRVRGERETGGGWDDAARVLDDLTSWRRTLVPGAGVPIPQPELLRILADASPAELDSLVPEFFGDIAVFGYGRLTDSVQVQAIELSTRLDAVPNPDSRVSLGSDRDAFGVPRVRLDWRLSELDRRSADRALELLGQEIGRAGIGRLQVRLTSDAAWPSDLEGGYHHMGTTRMSADPRTGVVDADCRVHGLDNLYVAGSSVFTTGGSATPTLTLVALALRLADHLRGRLE